MIFDLKTNLFNKINLTLNQLVLISLLLENRTRYQNILMLVSHINDAEVKDLIDRNLICINSKNKYEITDTLLSYFGKDDSFKLFKELYPIVVTRPDGTQSFLHGNIKKCEKQYYKIIKDIDKDYIFDCLKKDIDNKTSTGKLGYMKTMWKWLTQCEWETIDTHNNLENQETYGTELL